MDKMKEDTAESRAWCLSTRAMLHEALNKTTPLRHLLPKNTWFQIEQFRHDHFGNMPILFGNGQNTEQAKKWATNLEAYVNSVHETFTQIAEIITHNPGHFSDAEIAVVKDMPNKLLWLFNTNLNMETGLNLDTQLPLLTPNFASMLADMLHSHQNAWAEVSHSS